jgi:hypothetical protein
MPSNKYLSRINLAARIVSAKQPTQLQLPRSLLLITDTVSVIYLLQLLVTREYREESASAVRDG